MLDHEEKLIISKADTMTKDEVWHALEMKRYNDLKRTGVQLSGEMMAKARCPKCTLQPPCKHYNTADEIVQSAWRIVN